MPNFSGLYDYVHQVPYSPLGGQNLRRSLQRRLMKTRDGRKFIAQAQALIGQTVGSQNVVITDTHLPSLRTPPHIPAGKINAQTDVLRNSPSTAVDRGDVAIALAPVKSFVFAKDRSGNGGDNRFARQLS